MISGALKLATQKPTDATKKATGKQPIATPKPPLADTIQSLLGSTGPVQGPVENPIRQTMRKTSEARLNQAARAGKAEGKRQAIAEKVSKQDNRLTFDTIFGQVNLTMPPDIAFQYETADPGGKLAIIKQFHDNAVDAGIRSGQQIVPRWQNSPAAQSLILNKILPPPLPTTPGEIIAPTAPPQITDERTRFEPYTPGSVGAEMAGILGRAVEGTPQYQAFTSQRQLFPEVYTGVAAKFRQAGSNLENLLPVNPMLNFPAQFLESAADVADPNAGVGETIIGGASITPALWPYVKGGLVASNLLRAGSKFAPALEAGLNAAAREGIIGWSLLEGKVRAKDIANILEKAGTFNEAGYYLRQTERADFIRRLQEDAKAWARKNGKNENEILELEEEFYKDLLRPAVETSNPTGTLSRGATADFQPAISGPVRMSTRAGELAIPEAERYQQIIPSAPMDDDAIENLAMDTWQRMVANGASEQDATQMATQIAKTLKDDAKKPITVYHGTTTEFEGAPSVGMSRTGAIHVTPNRAFAEQFTDINQGRAIGETPTVKEFSLDPSKVADLRQPDLKQDFIDFVVKKYGMKKPDPFDDEWEVINTGVFDPEGFRGNSRGISIDDLSDDIDQGAYWVAESKAAKDWAESRGYAGVKAIEGESGSGVETFAIFDPKALGMEAPKPTPKIQKWLDGNDTRIAELEKRTSGRMYSGIDPDVVELAARRAIKTSYLAGVSLVEAVKQQFDNLKLLFAGDGLDLELEAQYLDEIENQSRLLMQTTELPSSMDLVVRTEKIDEVLPGAQVKMNKEDAAKLLEKYTRDLLENPEGIKLTNENREVIVRVLANTLKKETIAAIKSGGEGQGFYSLSIDDANNALDQLFPGITDTQKKLFHIISAPASSGNTPKDESAYGVRLLEEYLQTGKFKAQVKAKNTIYDSKGKLAYNVGDTLSGPGTRGKGIVTSHETMEKVFDYFGNDPQKTLDFFLTEWPEDKFREYYKILKGGSPKLKDLEAGPNGGYYGTLLLGPKVGQYALNKLGLGGTTKDLWFYRMVNRIAGSLVFKNKELADEIFEAGFLSTNSIGKQVSNEATALAAKELGISERVLQEITWANEQKIYKSLGVSRRGGSIRDGVEKIAKEQGVKLKPLDPVIKAKAQAAIDAEQAKVLKFTKNDPLYGTTKGNIEKNRERITELEGLIQSKTKSLGGNRQRGAYVPPTKEELELLARRALNMVYTGGEKIADAVKSLAKGFGMPEGQENAIFDAIRKIDPEAVKDIPTTATTEVTTEAATKTPDLIATANRITADVRRSVGLDDVNKVSPEQIADWEEEARKINTEKLMDDMLATNKLRPLTKSEELAMGARLSRALERYDAAQRIIEDADFVTTDMLDRAQSAREEILKISDFTNAVGTEWGRAGVARQALIRADYTTAGVISKIKKAEVAASKVSTKEVRASAQQIADAEEFAKQAREKDAKIAELEKKIEDLRAQGAKEAPKRRIEARRKRLEAEADDILAQIFQTRNRPSPGIKQGPEKGAVSIDVEKNVELMNLYGKLAKNFIQRGALNIEDVYTSVSEIAKQAGHAITKQGLIDALDQQAVIRRTRKVRGATKAEILQRQKLNREIAKGSTRGQEAAAKAVAEKEVIRKAREEALALKKAENEAKRQAIRAEKQAANAQAKAEADAYRAEARAQREEARRLAKEQRKVERQAKIDARQARREELNQALGPIARDERKIANLKGRIEDYNRMIETGEFFASRPLKEGDEGYELTHLQEQVDLLRYEAKMAKMNVDGIIDDISQPKWVKVMKEVVGLPRYFQLGLDAGALTRQGFDIALVSPKAWTKAAKAGFGAAISNPAKVAKMEEEFMRSPEVLKAIANGLAIDGPSEFPEGFVSKLSAKVPGYGRGERFHKTFQNFARFEAYKNLTRNQNLNQYQLKEVAKLINAMTGRGNWTGAEGPLASIFTAPKMYAGQLEVMGKTAIAAVDPRFYTNPAYRKLIVRRWLGRMGGLVALKTLADATDWEFSINPDDSDFLKLRNGNTVIDVTGGYSSWYKLLFGTLNMIADTGMNPSLEKDLIRVLGYKVSPSARTPLSLITGKDAVGNPFFVNPDTKEREVNVKDLAKTFAPLIGVQIYEMAGGDEEYQDMDLGAKVGLGALGFVGTGVSKYPARESRRPVEETKWGQLLDQIGVQPR